VRTTLDIAADVLQAAREIAAREGQTAGRVLSELARRGLREPSPPRRRQVTRGGVPLLPSRGEVITLERVRQLMDTVGV
jgi:hypothetical protein